MKHIRRLGVGTVQFGTTYGIANLYGQVGRPTVVDILKLARAAGVELIDTAAMYGQAEEVLSDVLKKVPGFQVVTKTLTSAVGIEAVTEGVRRSRHLLGDCAPYGVLVHSASDLVSDSGPTLWGALRRLQDDGVFGRLGFSAYASDDVLGLARQYRPQIVQIPVSVLDQRLVRNGTVRALKDLGVEVHARSVFLQGVLFLNPQELPVWLRHMQPELGHFHRRLKEFGLSAVDAAVSYPLSIGGIDKVVVGISSRDEAVQILQAANSARFDLPWPEFAIDDAVLLDPRLWVSTRTPKHAAPLRPDRPFVLAIVQARMSSSRLPGKVLKPILGRPMIGHHIDRLHRCHTIDRIIVATSGEESDDAIARFCAADGIGCYRGPLGDVLARFEGAAREYAPADHVVRLTGDCPLADPEVIDETVSRHLVSGNAYTSNVLEQTFPNGLDVEVMTRTALSQAAAEANDLYDREHVTPFLYRRPGRYQLGNVRSDTDHGNMRWTVDTEADFRMVEAVYRELYAPNKSFGYRDILKLLDRRPDIALINSRSE